MSKSGVDPAIHDFLSRVDEILNNPWLEWDRSSPVGMGFVVEDDSTCVDDEEQQIAAIYQHFKQQFNALSESGREKLKHMLWSDCTMMDGVIVDIECMNAQIYALKKTHSKRSRSKSNEERDEQFARMYDEMDADGKRKWSYEQIARKYDVSRDTVISAIKRHRERQALEDELRQEMIEFAQAVFKTTPGLARVPYSVAGYHVARKQEAIESLEAAASAEKAKHIVADNVADAVKHLVAVPAMGETVLTMLTPPNAVGRTVPTNPQAD